MSARLYDSEWAIYKPAQRVGKLCYHYCSKHSHLPIRDVLNDHKLGFKKEPNYETASYNWCAGCNRPAVSTTVRNGLSHILFITKYTGSSGNYVGRYFIVGYYEIGWVIKVDVRYAVRARKMCFVPIERAYEVTPERWQRININGSTRSLKNLRYATQRISGKLLDEILQPLDRHNAADEYLREVSRLKAEYNPFERVPDGRIFIINVGANASSPLQSPLFGDESFELVPIPEHKYPSSDKLLTYADLRQFNQPGEPLLDLFSQTVVAPREYAHNDPEFDTLTYGDNVRNKSNLRDLRTGDFLFFLARLVPYGGQQFNRHQAIFALIGYLEYVERLDDPDNPLFQSPAFIRNAHVRRWMVDPSGFTNFAILKGSVNSRRFSHAVPFTREFVEHVPILKADGRKWQWDRTSALGIIGSYTRTVRMHIDPGTSEGQERAKRFWRRVWEKQKRQTTQEAPFKGYSCEGGGRPTC